MKRIFRRKDGGLNTGFVSVAVFIALIIGFSLLFKAREQFDRVRLKVAHVFVAKPQQRPERIAKPMNNDHDNKQRAEAHTARQAAGAGASANRQEDKERKVQAAEFRNGPSSRRDKPIPVSTRSVFPSAGMKDKEIKADKDGVIVGKDLYLSLMHHWLGIGKVSGRKSESLPLRVRNLRETYSLLQMKPVALINNKEYFDLTDKTRLSAQSLEEYSTTVFTVDDPWGQWGEALRAAGIHEGAKVEVRYYVYDFVRNAMYERVQQAFSWCRSQKLISSDIKPGDVDVLGRTFVIHRQGGGSFGVFLPVAIDTPNGRVAVGSSCFAAQPDVAVLHKAGLI